MSPNSIQPIIPYNFCQIYNPPEKLLITKVWTQKTNRNKPENKAEKLLKIRTCGKNKAKNKPGHVVENK
jgi:hypothetical protein